MAAKISVYERQGNELAAAANSGGVSAKPDRNCRIVCEENALVAIGEVPI